jgi:cell wall-associated NlpC family hydrolase
VRLFERAAGFRVDGVLSLREMRALKRAAAAGRMAGAVSLKTTQPATTATTASAGQGTPADQPTGQIAPPPAAAAQVGGNGLAIAPAGAPAAVAAIIQAGNVIAHMPYRFGGGHQSWQDSGYDCSGSVSFALHGAGLLDVPLASYDFYTWGEPGPGQWVTIYAKDDHAYMVVAGLRFDTAASKGGGSRWTAEARVPAGYVARHPAGL